MPRPPEAAPALIYKEGSDVIIDGDTYAPETDTPGLKVYRALLTQTGTDAPVPNVLENSLGGTLVWTRSDVGEYVGTLAGVFLADKVFAQRGTIINDGDAVVTYNIQRATDNTITLNVLDDTLAFADLGISTGLPVQILVYP